MEILIMQMKFLIFSLFIISCSSEAKLDDYIECPSDTSVNILAALINSEAGQDKNDMYLVGSTVLNRIDNKEFPDNLISVIHQKGQYNGVKTDNFYPTEDSRWVAEDLLMGINRDTSVLFFIKKEDTFSFGGIKKVCSSKYHNFFSLK